MGLRINDTAPDFTADSTEGPIRFHDWMGDGYAIIFSHPRDFTPVCTTEFGAVAQMLPEFRKRNTKVVGISVDSVDDHHRWKDDISAVGGAPAGAIRHTATFKLDPPITSTNAVRVVFKLKQRFSAEHLIGRFRLYVTTSDSPLDFGLPEAVVQAVRAPAGQRTPEQSATIVDYYRYTDAEFWRRKQAVADVSMPLPADPKLVSLQTALTNAEQPVRLDPYLLQLREDAKVSGKQNENPRLTVVQDLTWALINSPGFLFNH